MAADMISPAAFIAHARTWIGVPFVLYGRTRDGVDCGGLPIGACRELGLVGADWFADMRTTYAATPRRPGLIAREVATRMKQIPRQPAALIIFREIAHLATSWPAWFAIDAGPTLIGCAPGRGVIEVRALVRRQFHSAWALPGIAYAGST